MMGCSMRRWGERERAQVLDALQRANGTRSKPPSCSVLATDAVEEGRRARHRPAAQGRVTAPGDAAQRLASIRPDRLIYRTRQSCASLLPIGLQVNCIRLLPVLPTVSRHWLVPA